MKKHLSLPFYLCLLHIVLNQGTVKAETTVLDTTLTTYAKYSARVDSILPHTWKFMRKFEYATEQVNSGTLLSTALLSAEVIGAGLLFKGDDTKYNNHRSMLEPVLSSNFEDYLQYAPFAAMYGLKLAGVEGRSSWTRMLTTDAIGLALNVGMVQLLKRTIDQTRPDGSDNRSFPSGHASMAFLGATLMHHEYGLTRSPWYSIGAYSTALATSMARQLHNKHWLSDVMVGAGIGIMAGELAYWITDRLFGEKGLIRPDLGFGKYDYQVPHSSLGLVVATSHFFSGVSLSDGSKLKVRSPHTIGLTGEWGLTPNLSLVGRYSFTNGLLYYNDTPLESQSVQDNPSWYNSSRLRMNEIDMGAQYSYPLSLRWSIYGKATLGYTYYNKVENDYSLWLGERGGLNYGAGAGVGYLMLHNLRANAYLEYQREPALEHRSSSGMNNVILGSSFSVLF